MLSTRSINIRGVDETRAKWEQHWNEALSDDDLNYLTTVANITTIRLPLGFFTLGPTFCEHTAFAMAPAKVYKNAWSAVKSLVQRCYGYGVGVILDMHALPGGANTEIHSGTSVGKADLWNDPFHRDIAYRCFQFIATELAMDRSLTGVIGIQLVNESSYGAPGMYEFCDHAVKDIAQIHPTIPIYISDGWDLRRALAWAKEKNTVATEGISNPIIVDTHKYYAFSDRDTKRAPQALIAQVSMELNEALDDALLGTVFDNNGAVAVFVGEYSCALSHLSWERVESSKRKALTKQFGLEQGKRWRERSCGSAFWTFTTGITDKPEWSFTAQVDSGAIASPPELRLRKEDVLAKLKTADHQRSKLMMQGMQDHSTYWGNQAPGARFEHWRYADGWHLGWIDGRNFYSARSEGMMGNCSTGADAVGMVDLWVLKRMKEERVSVKEECEFGWEWEIGFRAGLIAFETCVGLS
jgi:aryl-phospho-beta-D-glucosidase BglC (GH1 family)